MTRHTVRVPCPVCEGTGSLLDDEMGVPVDCYHCNALGYLHENATAPACDVVTHEDIAPVEGQ